jgi:hypothetical protein
MSGRATNDEPQESAVEEAAAEPATLFRVMQTAIGEGLREHYEAPRKMSHQLFVLMMQMNDRARRERAQAEQATRAKTNAKTNGKTKAGKRQEASILA